MAACATRVNPRPLPPVIETNCQKLGERVYAREQIFARLRGTATFESPGLPQLDAAAAVEAPLKARVELSGPLGVRLGLVLANERWTQLYLMREKLVHRFPSAELKRDNARRDLFLQVLPIPVEPDFFFDALLTRTALPQESKLECSYIESDNVYRFRFPLRRGGRIADIDPTSYGPVIVRHYQGALPTLAQMDGARAMAVLRYSDYVGDGMATLPRRVELENAMGKKFTWHWQKAEAVTSFDDAVFLWTPPASVTVKDY